MGSCSVISRVTIPITHLRGLIAPPITTHELPSSYGPTTCCLQPLGKVLLLASRWPPQGRHRGNIGALIIRIEFWGPLYYNYNKEPPKIA